MSSLSLLKVMQNKMLELQDSLFSIRSVFCLLFWKEKLIRKLITIGKNISLFSRYEKIIWPKIIPTINTLPVKIQIKLVFSLSFSIFLLTDAY